MVTRLTVFEIGTNYPDNIRIEAGRDTSGKYVAFCYLLRNGAIHKLILSTKPVFDTAEEATDDLTKVAEWCQTYIENENTRLIRPQIC